MHNDIDSRQCQAENANVSDVSVKESSAAYCISHLGGERFANFVRSIEYDDVVTCGRRSGNDIRPDEPATASDQNPHT